MRQACGEIANRLGLDVQQQWDGKSRCCRVFDADAMSYEEMLTLMSQLNDERVGLGTYSKEMGVIITENEVMV